MVIWVTVGLGEFVMSVGGETTNFIGVCGITPSLEGHQVWRITKHAINLRNLWILKSVIPVGVFGILPIVEVRQKQVKTLHNTTYFTLSRFW